MSHSPSRTPRRRLSTAKQLQRLAVAIDRLTQVYDDNYQILRSAAACIQTTERLLHDLARDVTTLKRYLIVLPPTQSTESFLVEVERLRNIETVLTNKITDLETVHRSHRPGRHE